MTATTSPPGKLSNRRTILGGAVGTLTEYYDFAIYGLLAPTIASQFFPETDPAAALLSTFLIFALGFLFRPLGGFIFGYFGDKVGRTKALTGAILLMAAATTAIGLLPTYASVGLLSPVLLLICRCLQSVSNGGEFAGATSYLAESAPRGKRALYVSTVTASSAIPSVFAIVIILTVSLVLDDTAFASWGWRVPFLLAAPLGLVGLYLRMHLAEPEVFTHMKAAGAAPRNPLLTGIRTQWRKMLLVFAGAAVTASSFYIVNSYMVSYTQTELGVGRNASLFMNGTAVVVFCLAILAAGHAADRFGRRPVILTGLAALVVLGVPAFLLMQTGHLAGVLLGQVLFCLCIAPVSGVVPALSAELFPTAVRYSCNSMSYNLAYTVFAGTAPYVAAWLVSSTGLLVSPAVYASSIALVAGVAIFFFLQETGGTVLEQGVETAGHPGRAGATRPPDDGSGREATAALQG
ncbi:MFS transporter [Streptomyces hygroscopicus]|uniref:MFS transporter n=1 Tax=Streptomyces hygroscopicus TaxID=1912 RepID=UPI0008304D8A|nr:MFS transporter [Streptomyces hygroscopicus]GLV73419.1 MFS transporter [Streptomyces hygroscopicus subsp. hygroscopicus]